VKTLHFVADPAGVIRLRTPRQARSRPPQFFNTPSGRARGAVLFLALALASCVGRREAPQPVPMPQPPVQAPAPVPAPPPPPANAVQAGAVLVSAAAEVPAATARAGYESFKRSCSAISKRNDASGLTQPGDWAAACAVALPVGYTDADAAGFFREHFEVARVGDGRAFATGYFEPEIAGSRVRMPGFDVPVYRVPPDLVQGTFADGKTGRGRYDETGAFVLYHDRAAIDAGALAGKGLEIAWAADPIEMFFLQIQGSGRLRQPDGSVMRIGYAGQNGREYVAIGRVMKERGLLGPGQTSMQGIVGWLRANPEAGRAIMAENKSYVFFQELTGPGPLGSIGVPVTGRSSIAVDPKFVPYGAPVLLSLDKPEASGLWVAHDTGGAIRGANRFDTFWGAGEQAKLIAGGMQARGDALILLPKGTVARLRTGGDARAQR